MWWSDLLGGSIGKGSAAILTICYLYSMFFMFSAAIFRVFYLCYSGSKNNLILLMFDYVVNHLRDQGFSLVKRQYINLHFKEIR